MVDKLKLTTYVELLAYFERVGELPVHLTLEDRVVKQVEDHSMGTLVGVLEDAVRSWASSAAESFDSLQPPMHRSTTSGYADLAASAMQNFKCYQHNYRF